MKTVFFGASAYVLPLLEFLHANYDLALVVTTESNSADAVPQYCKKNNIPFLAVKKLDAETAAKIKNLNAPFAVLADFRLMIRQDVIDIFPKGIINIHPSLLPQYRGPTPGTTALLDGREETGVSLMLLDKDLDHGPLIGQEKVAIEPTDTSATLYTKLFKKGVDLLEKVLPDYLHGTHTPTPQDHNKATYTDYLTRESGYIDLSKIERMSHLEIENWKLKIDRMIRAYYPWPGVWTLAKIKNKEVRIKFLPGNLIQVVGKKSISYQDFIHGYEEGKIILGKLGLLNS